jgi:hypothetical protein
MPILTTGRWKRSPNRKVVPRRLIQRFTFMKVRVMIAKKIKPIFSSSTINAFPILAERIEHIAGSA